MLGLEELALKVFVKQCIATIVEYHGFHRNDVADKIDKDINTRIAMPDKELLLQLKAEIELDIKKSEDYKLREPLLNYCLDLFAMINPVIEKNELLDTKLANQIKSEIEQFLLIMQMLYTKNKDTEFKIHFNNKDYSLWGFQNTGARSYLSPYCQSGYIIEKHFFKTFRFKLPTELANKPTTELTAQAEKEIKSTSKEMIDEFQLPLITARLEVAEESLATRNNEINELKEEFKAQKDTLENQLDKNDERIAKLEKLLKESHEEKLTSANNNQIDSLKTTNQELLQQAPTEPQTEPKKDYIGFSALNRPGIYNSLSPLFGMFKQPTPSQLGVVFKLNEKERIANMRLDLKSGENASPYSNT